MQSKLTVLAYKSEPSVADMPFGVAFVEVVAFLLAWQIADCTGPEQAVVAFDTMCSDTEDWGFANIIEQKETSFIQNCIFQKESPSPEDIDKLLP